MMAKKKQAATNKKGGSNEFFRGHESGYHGGDKTIMSPAGSAFNCPTLSSNVMEREIAAQATKSGKRMVK